MADTYIKLSVSLNALSTIDKTDLTKYFLLLADFFEKTRVRSIDRSIEKSDDDFDIFRNLNLVFKRILI